MPHILERLARVEQRLDAQRESLPTRKAIPLLAHGAGQEGAGDSASPAVDPEFADSPRQAPLSRAALSGRLLPKDERTIVHVTIDRIDVRAPASQAPLRSARQARKAAPSVSLASYLRGARSSGEPP
jgi:hypothetical protein